MRNPAARSRPDANQAAIIEAYEACWVSVIDLHGVGFGCPDILCGIAGENHLVEIKTEKGKLRAAQERFATDWRGSKVVIIRSVEDALNHVKTVRNRVFGPK